MKKNFLKAFCSLMLSALLFSGCEKVTEKELRSEDPVSAKDEQDQATVNSNGNDNNKCRLSSFVQSDGYHEKFHYNNEGLADRWYIEYGDGTAYDHRITYDKKNRIKSTRVIIPGDVVNYIFYNNGDHTSRATGRLQSTGELFADIFYSYNHKGQMVKLDDDVGDIHSRFFYDNKGFNRRMDLYFGSELSYTYFLNYDISNKNPYLALHGVDFGFPSFFFNAPMFDKRWNSSGSFVVYEEGNPIVIAEDDPAQTNMQTAQQNYLTYVSYYDITSESAYDLTFKYKDCGGHHAGDFDETTTVPSVKATTPMRTLTRLKKILDGHSKNMKQELKDLKRQYLTKLKPLANK